MSEAEQIEEQPSEEQAAPESTEQVPENTEQPEGEEQPQKVEFAPEQQEILNREISKRVKAQREAERKAEEERQRREEIEQKLRASQEPERPVVPPKPTDMYDPNYEKEMDAYADALAQQRVYDERKSFEQQQRDEVKAAERARAEQEYQRQTAEYFDRGDKLGIEGRELNEASQVIDSFQVHPGVAEYLMLHERGPEMAVYLKNNLPELQKVAEMHPMLAAEYLSTTVREAAKRPPPKLAPAPVRPVEGAGAPPDDDGITILD